MAKQIKFTYKGEDYCLEYTRRTVKMLEADGFRPADVGDKPGTAIPQLFAGAFKAHHPFVKSRVIDEIFDLFTNKIELVNTLAEMYAEPLEAMMDEPKEGNLTWTVEN